MGEGQQDLLILEFRNAASKIPPDLKEEIECCLAAVEPGAKPQCVHKAIQSQLSEKGCDT